MELQGLAWSHGLAGEEEVASRLAAILGLQHIGGVVVDVEDHVACSETQGCSRVGCCVFYEMG